MPRRSKGESFFDDLQPTPADYKPDPPTTEDLADDERAILAGREPIYAEPTDSETESEPTTSDAIHDGEETGPQSLQTPPEKQKSEPTASTGADKTASREARRQRKRKDDGTLVERVRARASKSWLKRIQLYEHVMGREDVPYQFRLRAAEKLDELSIGKAPTAPQLDKGRPKILIGVVGGSATEKGLIRSIGDIQPGVKPPKKTSPEEGETFHA